MRPAVSVIVPVYNPGQDIDRCIASLLGQSLGELELIFVDDGSTDGTAERLEALAREHSHVRAERIPNSGWPGRPRNVGIDLARGEYVYFVDDDDWVEPDAVERLHAAAQRDGADIVIGKVVGHGKTVPRGMFRESLHAVRFDSARLLGLLTPHKLFRRQLLVEHDIRFPEGRRRLEDHLFVVHAYFHADAITVLADRPYYHWTQRDHTEHASHQRMDPVGYYGNVREVLDLVCEHTDPGPFRDLLLTHWYRGKMLQRAGGPKFIRREDAHNRRLVETIRTLALERYDEHVHERLAFNLRVRSALLRAGSYEGLQRLAQYETALGVGLKARMRRDGSLRLTAALEGLELDRDGDRVVWRPPPPLREALTHANLDVTDALASSSVQVFLHSLSDESEYLVPAFTLFTLDCGRVVLTSTVEIDPSTAAAGAPLPEGDWDVRATVSVAGFSHTRSARVVLRSSRDRVAARPDVLLRHRLAARRQRTVAR